MFHSIKTKLIVAISVLIVVVLGLTALILINEKKQELSQDIYLKSKAFASLTAAKIVDFYDLYLKEGSFVYFNREIKGFFQKNEDLESIGVINYEGEILYDSQTEQAQQYQGETRLVEDESLLQRVQATYPSFLTKEGRVVYLKKTADSEEYVDLNEKPVSPLKIGEKVVNIVYPVGSKYVVVYAISYQHLQERIAQMATRIALLALLGILIALLLGYVLAGGITKPLQELKEGAVVIGQGDFKRRVEVKTKDEVGILAATFNKMAKDLEVSTKALIYKERVGKELELAAKIQKDILPQETPKVKGIDLSGGLIPATEIGGDCYDFIPVDKENLMVYIGDVAGHGVPSGLIVSVANALFHSYAELKDPRAILNKANQILRKKTTEQMFITLLFLHWNISKQKLTYVCAGHPQMIYYSAKDQKVIMLPGGGVALGMVPDISQLLKEEVVDLRKGDVLVLYSDGIPEAKKGREEYGMGRLKRAVEEYAPLENAEKIKEALLTDVQKFLGKSEQKDDITVVVVKRV